MRDGPEIWLASLAVAPPDIVIDSPVFGAFFERIIVADASPSVNPSRASS